MLSGPPDHRDVRGRGGRHDIPLRRTYLFTTVGLAVGAVAVGVLAGDFGATLVGLVLLAFATVANALVLDALGLLPRGRSIEWPERRVLIGALIGSFVAAVAAFAVAATTRNTVLAGIICVIPIVGGLVGLRSLLRT
jgi:hypothetical protein